MRMDIRCSFKGVLMPESGDLPARSSTTQRNPLSRTPILREQNAHSLLVVNAHSLLVVNARSLLTVNAHLLLVVNARSLIAANAYLKL